MAQRCEIEGAKSRYALIVPLARREQLTVRQLIGRAAVGAGTGPSPAPRRRPIPRSGHNRGERIAATED